MMLKDDASAAPRIRFRLRSLFLLMLIAGSFMGGWVANEARHKYIIKDDAKIEFIDGTQLMVVRGAKEDVEVQAETLSKAIESDDSD